MAFNLESYVQNYNVHQETIDFLKDRTARGDGTDVAAAREAAVRTAAKFGGHVDFVGTEEEHFIEPSATTEAAVNHVIGVWRSGWRTPIQRAFENFENDTLPVTVYRPKVCEHSTDTPILVYFHGGGNVIKSRRTNENVCRILASDTPCIVVSVEYRLAPEHMFPANNDDAKRAVDWVAENKVLIGGTAESKLGVIGDSAGGRLSAVVCHEAYTNIHFAVLVYPKVDYTKTYKSTEEFKFGPTLPKKRSDWYAEQYITEEDKSLPRASVILNKDFSYLPPTLIIVAEHDQLRDGCYEYHEKLKASGVTVQLELIKGVPHAFWSLQGAFKENCQTANKLITDFIRRHSSYNT